MQRRIYVDYGATTPTDPRVVVAMVPYFTEKFGNAGSIHAFGQEAREAVDRAREIVASAIGGSPQEIVFTSGATEADNFAVLGAAWGNEARGRHLITSSIEHHAVLEPCRFLEGRGFEVTYLPVDRTGWVDPDDVRRAIRPDTILISVMSANNEIGTLEPVAEIGRIARDRGILMHTDATQSVGIMPVHVDALCVDLLSLSAHKRYGPKGVGALYVRKGSKLTRVQGGGSQERNRRAGTENVPGIVGFGAALALALEVMDEEASQLRRLRDRLIDELARLDGAHLNGHRTDRLPGNINLSFEGRAHGHWPPPRNRRGNCAPDPRPVDHFAGCRRPAYDFPRGPPQSPSRVSGSRAPRRELTREVFTPATNFTKGTVSLPPGRTGL